MTVVKQSFSAFRTDRLLLRPFVPDDVEDAFAIFGDAEVMRYSVSGCDPDMAATAARVERYIRRTAETGLSPWAIAEVASKRVVGFCGLMRLPGGDDVEIAYRLRRDRWGRGIATEAAAAWLERGFLVLRLPRIFAFVDPENTGSVRVIIKIGMRFVENAQYQGLCVGKYEISASEHRQFAASHQ
jgi:[ribosomal protein S5]-alanine N-acetyltransferase